MHGHNAIIVPQLLIITNGLSINRSIYRVQTDNEFFWYTTRRAKAHEPSFVLAAHIETNLLEHKCTCVTRSYSLEAAQR
jgi:hypothetical protein